MTVSAGGHRYSIDDPVLIAVQSLTAFHQYASFLFAAGIRAAAPVFYPASLKATSFLLDSHRSLLLKPLMQRNDERCVKLYVRLRPSGAGIMMRRNP